MLAEPKAMQVILASENKTAAGLGFDRNSLIPRELWRLYQLSVLPTAGNRLVPPLVNRRYRPGMGRTG
jgi:hypothetical protein